METISKEQVLKQARIFENYQGNESDILGAEKGGKFHGFIAGAEWAIEKLEAEKAELQQWKDSALEVMNQINLQEVGKVLNLQLGSSVSEQILPSIKKLVADKAELLEALKYANRMLKNSKDAMYDEDYIESLIQKHKK